MMPQEKGSVRSLGKALELLELLNRSRVPMTLQALSQASGYPKSTIHSLLATLRSYGCIRQESDGRYYLGTKLFEWGCGVSAAWEITRCARPAVVGAGVGGTAVGAACAATAVELSLAWLAGAAATGVATGAGVGGT